MGSGRGIARGTVVLTTYLKYQGLIIVGMVTCIVDLASG